MGGAGKKRWVAAMAMPFLLFALAPGAGLAQHGGPGGREHGGASGRCASPSGARRGAGEHLPQWFAQHKGMTPGEQDNALRREPGFGRLPEGQQQQIINRLHNLGALPAPQRQRMLERNERFEALPPERQQEIRGASQALGQMSPDRRQAVRQAFRDLRTLPPDQRDDALGSARFGAEYTPQERTVLGNLLSIEPYHPPQ